MTNDICYRFPNTQIASRFLHGLKHWPVADVATRLLDGGLVVQVRYQFDDQGFDYTLAELDELAAKHGGSETS
ncbi:MULTISPECIES: hypothetical protein [Alkalimonas]|uniref:Uncharacterized protein n=1 Tax=Alkalimonas mucilaginosa TaxID=3057676 RepID=A0ABU7JGQ2_9GAMM|nr:hypothetical protein [Alkalimonas sp. MEB004]MEE2024854.1 hypothetical protein [Alkalimonas sp. MEB004]